MTSINSVMLSPNLVLVILKIQVTLYHSQGKPIDSDKTYVYVIIQKQDCIIWPFHLIMQVYSFPMSKADVSDL